MRMFHPYVKIPNRVFCFIWEYKILDSFGVILKNMNAWGGHLGSAKNGAHSQSPACLRAEFETTMSSPSVVQILELCIEVNIRKTNKTDYDPLCLGRR